MTIKNAIYQNSGFQYIIEKLELLTAVSRKILYKTEFSTNAETLQKQWNDTESLITVIKQDYNDKLINDLGHCLMQIRDINTTLQNSKNGLVLDDIQLFEIKNLAILCTKIKQDIVALKITHIIDIEDFSNIVQLLDPDKTGVPHFYIYDSYDERLPLIRKDLRLLQAQNSDNDNQKLSDLWQKNNDIETEIRTKLSKTIQTHAPQIIETLDIIGQFDILWAKAKLSLKENLCKPQISKTIDYQGLFNIRLRNLLQSQNSNFQPVGISLNEGLCIITGANMAGKTVLLKSLGIAQLMAQFGFFVPAQNANIALVDDVIFCIGDEQDEMNGLSSFASEILKINNIIERAKKQTLLVLIDEPARTTNPIEGMAIVKAVADFLNQQNSFSCITTHYSNLDTNCKKLRVRGLKENIETLETLTPQNINHFIDYTLVEDNSNDVPHEAIRIAKLFNFDKDVINKAKEFLKK